MRLSEHFTLEEFCQTDQRDMYATNLALAAQEPILGSLIRVAALHEEIRALRGIPYMVTSGFRFPALNDRIHGSPNSQHMLGQAADGHFMGRWSLPEMTEDVNMIADWGRTDMEQPKFHQALIEPNGCIHVSIPTGWNDGEVAFAWLGEDGKWNKEIWRPGNAST